MLETFETLFLLSGIIVGIAILIYGSDVMVKGAVSLAFKLEISVVVISMTIVGFGTSAPELAVSMNAAYIDQGGIAIGNVVGSNITNILLILGFTGVMCPFIPSPNFYVKIDWVILVIITCLVGYVFTFGFLSRWNALSLLIIFILFLLYSYKRGRKEGFVAEDLELNTDILKQKSILMALLMLLVGLVMVILGAEILVNSAKNLTKTLGVSDTVIGLTIVALGTSAPELSVSVVAAYRKETSMALGNIIGSNIFNLLLIPSVTGLIVPYSYKLPKVNIVTMIALTVVLGLFILFKLKFSRTVGIVFSLMYIVYILLVVDVIKLGDIFVL